MSLEDLALQPSLKVVQQLWSHCQSILLQQSEQTMEASDDEESLADGPLVAQKIRIFAAVGRLVAFQVC